MQDLIDPMLRIQAKICYATGLGVLTFSLWYFVVWIDDGSIPAYEKAIVLGLLAIGLVVVGWVVEVAVRKDTGDVATGSTPDR